MSFWVQHGLHLALVVLPSSAMGTGLLIERRKGQRERHAVPRTPAAVGGPPQAGIGPGPAGRHAAGAVTVREQRVGGGRHRADIRHPCALPAVAVAALGAALVHLVVMPEHFGESFLYGLFFLCAAVLQAGWALVVIYRPSRSALVAGGIGCAAVVLLWLVSRTVGVPAAVGGVDGGSPETFGALDGLATAFESVAVLGVLVALRDPRLGGGSPASWPSAAKAAAVIALCGTAVVAFWAPVS